MISIELDDRAVLAALAQLRDHARDLAPAFREIGSSLVDEIKLGFAEGRSPYGAPWKPLSPATQAANKGRRLGGQPLRDTGKLMGSIGRRIRVPARPYLPIQGGTAVLPDAWRHQILEILRDHLAPR